MAKSPKEFLSDEDLAGAVVTLGHVFLEFKVESVLANLDHVAVSAKIAEGWGGSGLDSLNYQLSERGVGKGYRIKRGMEQVSNRRELHGDSIEELGGETSCSGISSFASVGLSSVDGYRENHVSDGAAGLIGQWDGESIGVDSHADGVGV